MYLYPSEKRQSDFGAWASSYGTEYQVAEMRTGEVLRTMSNHSSRNHSVVREMMALLAKVL